MEMNKFYCCKGSAMYLAISLVLTTFGGKPKQLDFVHQTVAGTHARAVAGTDARAVAGTHARAVAGTHARAVAGTHAWAVAGTHAWAGNETTLLLRPCMMCVVFLLPLAC